MKKLFFLPIVASLLFTACNDDKEDPIPAPVSDIDAEMRGNWTNTQIKRVYYSINDTIMYQDSSNLQAFFSFDGRKMTVTLPDNGGTDTWDYSFPDEDNPNYIQLKQGSRTTDYLVTTINDSVMVWEDEEAWAGYPQGVPDEEKTTSKVGVYTWKFVRRD